MKQLKLILMLVLLLIVFTANVSASNITTLREKLIFSYNPTAPNGSLTNDTNRMLGNVTGEVYNTTPAHCSILGTDIPDAPCYYDDDGVFDWVDYTGALTGSADLLYHPTEDTNITFCAWVNIDGGLKGQNDAAYIFSGTEGGANDGCIFTFAGTGSAGVDGINIHCFYDGATDYRYGSEWVAWTHWDTWTFICGIMNVTAGVRYITVNNTAFRQLSKTVSTIASTETFLIGAQEAGNPWDKNMWGSFRCLNFFNGSLTEGEFQYLFETCPMPDAEAIDTTPPVFNIPVPLNNTAVNTLPLNFTINATDDISPDITCILSNTSNIFDEDTGTSGTHFNLTYNSSDVSFQRTMIFNITCFDNDAVNNNSAQLFLNITIDNVLPQIVISYPANNSVIDKTLNNLVVSAFCTDPNLIAFNYSLIDMAGTVIDSLQNNSEEGGILGILSQKILTNISVGGYNVNFTCADGHTYFNSRVEYVIKDEFSSKVYYGTESKNDISIQLIDSSISLCDFGSRSASDREIFWYDFRCNLHSKAIYTYVFILRDNNGELKYLPKSNYKAHFVTKENFITFQLGTFANYYVKKVGKNYEITIYTTETFLNFKNSIGGNNYARTFHNITIIQSSPIVEITNPLNESFINSINKIEWTTTDINSFTTNITISNSTDTTQIATNLGDEIINISYNFSILGEGIFIINVTSSENTTSPTMMSGTGLITITVQFPSISLNLSSPVNNSIDKDGMIIFAFLTDTANSNNCSLYIDNTINFVNQSVNATIGLNSFSEVELANGTHDWLVRCDNSTQQVTSEQWIIHIIFPDPQALSLLICPATTAGMMFLMLAVAISLFFILLAFIFHIGVIGVFGSIMLMITSWYLSPCINLFAYVIALFSMFLLIWFALSGLGFVNKTFQER